MTSDWYEIDQQGYTVVARISDGQISHIAMQELIDECEQRMRNDNARYFVFDMEQVEYLASACLGLLVGFLQDIEPLRGRIALAACCDNVLFLFKVTKLDTVFAIFDEVEEAVEEIAGDTNPSGTIRRAG